MCVLSVNSGHNLLKAWQCALQTYSILVVCASVKRYKNGKTKSRVGRSWSVYDGLVRTRFGQDQFSSHFLSFWIFAFPSLFHFSQVVQQQKAECSQKLEGLSMWLAGAASLLASQRPGAESGDVDILQEKQRKLKVWKSYINLSFLFLCIRFSSVILDIALISLKILVI